MLITTDHLIQRIEIWEDHTVTTKRDPHTLHLSPSFLYNYSPSSGTPTHLEATETLHRPPLRNTNSYLYKYDNPYKYANHRT